MKNARLIKARIELGMRLEDVGRAIGHSPSAICALENGVRPALRKTRHWNRLALDLASFYGLSVEHLFRREARAHEKELLRAMEACFDGVSVPSTHDHVEAKEIAGLVLWSAFREVRRRGEAA